MVAVEGPHVPPVVAVAVVGPGHGVALEVVDAGPARVDEHRDDVAAHVVARRRGGGVLLQRVDQHVGAEDVVAHRRVGLVGGVDQARRLGRLLQELVDGEPVVAGLDHAELPGVLARHPDARDRDAGPGLDVGLHHLGGVHAIDVVGAEHDDVVRPGVVDQVHRLVDRVGAAEVPVGPAALLRRHRGDVVAEQAAQPPGQRDVPVQRVRLVLRQHGALEVPGVDQVGQGEVDEAVGPAERDRWLGAVLGEGHQAFSLASGEDDGENAWHELTLGARSLLCPLSRRSSLGRASSSLRVERPRVVEFVETTGGRGGGAEVALLAHPVRHLVGVGGQVVLEVDDRPDGDVAVAEQLGALANVIGPPSSIGPRPLRTSAPRRRRARNGSRWKRDRLGCGGFETLAGSLLNHRSRLPGGRAVPTRRVLGPGCARRSRRSPNARVRGEGHARRSQSRKPAGRRSARGCAPAACVPPGACRGSGCRCRRRGTGSRAVFARRGRLARVVGVASRGRGSWCGARTW